MVGLATCKKWVMEWGATKLPDLDWQFVRYCLTTRLPQLSTDFRNSSSGKELSLKQVTKVWTDHTSEEPGTQRKSLPLASLEAIGQDGLTSWSVFTYLGGGSDFKVRLELACVWGRGGGQSWWWGSEDCWLIPNLASAPILCSILRLSYAISLSFEKK